MSSGGTSDLLRSSAIMALGTIVSRLTGFLRMLVLVWAIGATMFADTFNLANTIPNSLYILVAGGALNAVFVPVLVRAMKNDDDGGEAYAQRLLTLAIVVLGVMSLIAVLAAPWIIRLYASNELLRPETEPYYDLAVTFARYCLPQIFFYGVFVILGQILNARNRFGPMMWAPILNNVVSIGVFAAFIVVATGTTPETVSTSSVALLGLGSTAGIAVQALCLMPVLRRAGFRLRLRFDWRGAGLGRAARLAGWTIGFVIVNQLWFLAATRLTTGAGAQALQELGDDVGYGLTPYVHAFTIFGLPHAVIAVSLVTALLPRMSRAAADNDIAQVAHDLSYGMRVTAVVIIPAAFLFLALGPFLTVAMFQHGGEVNQATAQVIGYVLMGFSLGMVAFSSHHIVLRGFYAYEDTRTPFFVQIVVLGTSLAGAMTAYSILPVEWKTVGVSVAYSLGYWVGFAVSLAVLRRRLGGLRGSEIASTYGRAALAAMIAAGAAAGVATLIQHGLGTGPLGSSLAAGVALPVLILGYLALARLVRLSEVRDVFQLIRGRTSRSSETSS